jgi:hypothetical protein
MYIIKSNICQILVTCFIVLSYSWCVVHCFNLFLIKDYSAFCGNCNAATTSICLRTSTAAKKPKQWLVCMHKVQPNYFVYRRFCSLILLLSCNSFVPISFLSLTWLFLFSDIVTSAISLSYQYIIMIFCSFYCLAGHFLYNFIFMDGSCYGLGSQAQVKSLSVS